MLFGISFFHDFSKLLEKIIMKKVTFLLFTVLLAAGVTCNSGLLFAQYLTLNYSTYLGGTAENSVEGSCLDLGTDGTAYVVGYYTRSLDFPTVNPYQSSSTSSSGTTMFVSALSSSGSTLIYSTYLGGSTGAAGRGISVDTYGRAYVTGSTTSTDFPVVNPYQATCNGQADAFVAALSSTGSALIYSTYLGGPQNDFGWGIAITTGGGAYVTGHTISTDFPIFNAYQAKYPDPFGSPDYDAFVSALSSTGSALFYSTFLGGSDRDEGLGIEVGTDGIAYVSGETGASDGTFPLVNPYQASFGGGQNDAFITALSSTGSDLIYSTYLGGNSIDVARGSCLRTDGEVCVSGYTWSSNFPL